MIRKLCLLVMITTLSLPLFGFSNTEENKRAMWVEKAKISEESEAILEKAQQNDINVLYVKVNTEKDQKVYQNFIQQADKAGIQIHALGGEPSWALEENKEERIAFVDWVREYNQSVAPEEQFAGIHFKVQPQYLNEWYDDQSRVLREWKKNVTATLDSIPEDSTLEISSSIPFWLDNTATPGNPDVPFNTWLIQQFDHTTILAFRDTLEGENGIVSLTEEEFKAADQAGKQIMVGVTMADTGYDYTTFSDEGVADMNMHLGLIDEHLGEHSSYTGYAIDDYTNLLQQGEKASENEKRKRGTYIWEAETLINEKDKILTFAKENDINLLYTRLDLTQPYSAYSDFVEAANQAGIEVHAMGGHPSWALKEEEDRILDLVDYVKSYNENVTEAQNFDGIHLDIEPYVEPSWSTDQEAVLKQWMDNLELFVEETKSDSDLEASMDLAMWFDDVETPGHPDTPFNKWVINKMDHTSVMAFRDEAKGSGGIIDAAKSEVEFSEELGKDILISVEMKENPSHPHISFHEEGKSEMEQQLAEVDEEFKSNASYDGYVVHAYRYWNRAKE